MTPKSLCMPALSASMGDPLSLIPISLIGLSSGLMFLSKFSFLNILIPACESKSSVVLLLSFFLEEIAVTYTSAFL